jgi:hypothetical protein
VTTKRGLALSPVCSALATTLTDQRPHAVFEQVAPALIDETLRQPID